jgi:hypothetical protein
MYIVLYIDCILPHILPVQHPIYYIHTCVFVCGYIIEDFGISLNNELLHKARTLAQVRVCFQVPIQSNTSQNYCT